MIRAKFAVKTPGNDYLMAELVMLTPKDCLARLRADDPIWNKNVLLLSAERCTGGPTPWGELDIGIRTEYEIMQLNPVPMEDLDDDRQT